MTAAFKKRGQKSEAPTLPDWHVQALLIAYRIATYKPRVGTVWKDALDSADLTPEQREVATEYLRYAWKRQATGD